MKTYVINLDRNPERMAFVRRQLERLGIAFERFPAVWGKGLSSEERKRGFSRIRSFIASKKRLSDAEIGVSMSHVGVYRRMLADGIPYALVFEDDVILGEGFADALARAEAFLNPAMAQVIEFSGHGVANAESLPPEIRREKAIWCTDAYCLTLEAAKLILKANDPVITVSDSFKRWRRDFGLELYRVLPATVRQDDVTFKSENLVLPKANWLVRNLMWVLDRVLVKVTGR